jgi:CTP synthase
LNLGEADWGEWKQLVKKIGSGKVKKRIAVIGKYANMKDTYKSVFAALAHAAIHNDVELDDVLVNAEEIESGKVDLAGFDAFVVPGGFGSRGVEGIITAIQYAREHDVPYLGLCYGMQLAVIEFARNVMDWPDADSTEVNPKAGHPVVCILPEKDGLKNMGGTLRLGAHDVTIIKGTKAFEAYGKETISKRFRHRYEINPKLVPELEAKGIKFSGRDPKREIMKVMEISGKKFFMATQFHPEFDSRLEAPEPLFDALLKATLK